MYGKMAQSDNPYPVQFNVDYLEEERDRFTVFFRVLFIIPIAILLGAVTGESGGLPAFSGAAGARPAAHLCLGLC